MLSHEIEARLEELLDNHAGTLLSLYTEFGISTPPLSVEDLLVAYYKYGEPFVQRLEDLLALEHFDGEEKPKRWTDIFSTGLQILTTGAAVVDAFTNDNQSSSAPTSEPDPEILGLPRGLFIGVSVVVALLLIYLIINAKS